MKWWAWLIVGVIVMSVTTLIGWAMYKRERRGNPDSLDKARATKARLEAERRTADRVADNGSVPATSDAPS